MIRDNAFARPANLRPARHRTLLTCESLEGRTVLSTGSTGAALGKIAGVITNQSTHQGVSDVKVELINSNSKIIQTIRSGPNGYYAFSVHQPGAYVVKEQTPRGSVQTSPSFATTAPTGSYATGAGNASWNYSSTNTNPALGPVGPAYWATIAPEGSQPFESPINLHGPTVNLDHVIGVNFAPAVPTQIINNSHQIQAQFPTTAADNVVVGGTPYNLTNLHYHLTAENAVNGKLYAMEEHFVTLSASGGETVVAVFLKLGTHNNAFDPFLNAAAMSLTTPNSKTNIGVPIDFSRLLPTNHRGWFYEGSLTTPPLSEPVNWFLYATPISLDSAQIAEYAQVAGESGFLPNNRPLQPTQGRVLNEVDNQVNFTGTDVVNENFTIASGTAAASSARKA